MSTSFDCREALWSTKRFEHLDMDQKKVCIVEDHEGRICLTKANTLKERTKNIDLKFQTVLDNIKNEYLRVKCVASHHNVSDVMTKWPGKILFKNVREHLGLVSLPMCISRGVMLQYFVTCV